MNNPGIPQFTNRYRRGIAWCAGSDEMAGADADKLKAYYFFSSLIFTNNKRRIPIVTVRNLDKALDKIPPDYQGLMIVGNEPDRPDQDNQNGSEFINTLIQAKIRWPLSIQIGPNCIDQTWLFNSGFLSLWENGYSKRYGPPFHLWGLHHYTDDPSFTPSMNIDNLKNVLSNSPYDLGSVVVTEYGVKNTCQSPCDVMYQWTKSLDVDKRVILYLGFTNKRTPPFDMLDDQNNLTETGKGFTGNLETGVAMG